MSEENTKKELDIGQIMSLLPHRFPFLLVDRVLDYQITDEHKTLKAVKNITFNEPFFQGHFLGLQPEHKAGIACIPDELYYFAAIDNARFKRPVIPGDQLILDVEFLKEKRGIAAFKGVASVDGEVVCSADLMCAKRRG